MFRRVLSTVSLVSLLFTSVPASAQEGGPLPPRFEEIADEIGLTAEQESKVSELFYTSESAMVDVRARIRKAEIDLRYQMAAREFDEAKVRRAVDALTAAEKVARVHRMELAISLRKILTYEQWEQLQALRSDRDIPGPLGGEPPLPAEMPRTPRTENR